jgi:hypothetical protein
MAAGDHEVTHIEVVGNKRVLVGTLEADATDRGFALAGENSRILDIFITASNVDNLTWKARLNHDSSAAKNGSVAVEASGTLEGVFRATVV